MRGSTIIPHAWGPGGRARGFLAPAGGHPRQGCAGASLLAPPGHRFAGFSTPFRGGSTSALAILRFA
eukprot:77535-Lingulodinium_polyedra.AAC.1